MAADMVEAENATDRAVRGLMRHDVALERFTSATLATKQLVEVSDGVLQTLAELHGRLPA